MFSDPTLILVCSKVLGASWILSLSTEMKHSFKRGLEKVKRGSWLCHCLQTNVAVVDSHAGLRAAREGDRLSQGQPGKAFPVLISCLFRDMAGEDVWGQPQTVLHATVGWHTPTLLLADSMSDAPQQRRTWLYPKLNFPHHAHCWDQTHLDNETRVSRWKKE